MNEVYLLGVFNDKNEFQYFIRTGRRWTIPAFNDISGAKRCLGQVRSRHKQGERVLVMKASNLQIVEVLP